MRVMPCVTVIIPTYMRPDYLQRAIASVLAQTYKDWEIIVVARVTDETVKTRVLIKDFQSQHIPIELIEHHVPGVSSARNTAMHCAKGKYISFLDDDDQWLPNKLETQVHLGNIF